MRRTVLHPIAALALAALFVAPVSAVEPGGASTETLSGTLQGLWIESFEPETEAAGHDGASEHYDLRTSHAVVPLEFADGAPDGMSGATVQVTGHRVGRTLRVESSKGSDFRVRSVPSGSAAAETADAWAALDSSGTTSGTSTAEATYSTAAVTAKTFAIVLINFTNNSTQPWTKSTVASAVTGSSTSLRAFYEEESKGRMSIAASVYGWYTIDAATTGCDWRTWGTLGSNAATAAGVNLANFTNVMYIWPQTNECQFAGVAYVPGKYSYLNGTLNGQVMTHEVGHNFGISHSNERDCSVSGTRVWLAAAADCSTHTYADPFSTMGNNAYRHNHASHLGELGWLSDSEKRVGTPGNTYTIAPYFGAGTLKLVRIARGDGSFFDLDVRMPYGAFDTFAVGSAATAGVTIRLGVGTASPTGSPKMTELLDTTPATTDLNDAPLLVGRTVKDPVSTISFTTLAVDSNGVTVRVKEAIAPTTPGSFNATASDTPQVNLSWTAGTDNLAVASYKVTRNGASVATVPAGSTSWTDTGVASGTSYTYAVATVDTSGNASPAATATVSTPVNPNATPAPSPTSTPTPTSTPSPTSTPTPDPFASPAPTATPGPADAEPPTAPQPLDGAPAITTVSLTWGSASDDIGVTGYRITRNGSVVATTSGSATAWKDTSRTPKTTYTYTVSALDGAGHLSSPTLVAVTTKADTIRPSTPPNFHVAARSHGHVTFSWSASSDNVKVAKYALYRVGRVTPIKYIWGRRTTVYARIGQRFFVRAIDAAANRSYASRVVRGR